MRNSLRIILPIQEFFEKESTGGIILIFSTVLAMILANSPWADAYFDVLHHKINITFGENVFSMDKPIEFWINDFLMAIFFFVIGLEIKREVLAGELSSLSAASLPIAAAIGGMVVPASLYVLLNVGGNLNGWGVPMATDIAFTLGILTLMGKRIPLSLKIFLTALAIVDDLGGVLVIALFYTSDLDLVSLLLAGLFFVALMGLNYFKVYKLTAYAVLGIALWLFTYKSGIHPTIAGVLLAVSIPAKRRISDYAIFQGNLNNGMKTLAEYPFVANQDFLNSIQRKAVTRIYTTSKYALSPVQRLEHAFHPFVAFFVMPLFALANAGIPLKGDLIGSLFSDISLGIILGLVVGKQVGITLFTWLAVKLNLGELPKDLNWKMIYGLSCIAGIGFTMSLFIGNLAFTRPEAMLQAKIGIVAGSMISGLAGWLILSWATKPTKV